MAIAFAPLMRMVLLKRPQTASGVLAAIALSIGFCICLSTYAMAIPSFARQTGQPCASCHVAFPELTPFGRRFKLGGYTLEGGDSKIPPFAAMLQSSFTEYARKLDAPTGSYAPVDAGGFADNNFTDLGQAVSVFYGGKIYGNLGALIQTTYSNGYTRAYGIDNSDVRYANSATIGSLDFIYGVTVNDNPTVQDVWNTTPVWRYPYITSQFALTPATATMLESFKPGTNAGVGFYIFAHDLVYAELSGYGALSPRTQTTFGVCCGSPIEGVGGSTIDGVAPYWRVAVEPNWGDNSLEVGTFGMTANIRPGGVIGLGTDKITDIGVDSQYQYIGDIHAVTLRASYIYEKQTLGSTFYNFGASANPNNDLHS
ncbi:MAG TPA: hypothetical protein VKV96_20320, partial [Roseiarcus sp.]|nr:hypothetical protein [Roseiarcus sp.]